MKKLSRKWNIFIIVVVILIGGCYGYYKANNRNAFEEMYNSYFNILPISSLERMGQIKPIPLNDRQSDIIKLYY